MADQVHKGGCLCGRYRYRIEGSLLPVVHCHCAMCRKSSGAAVLSWTGTAAENMRWEHEEPPLFHSSEQARRGFCPQCGSQLTFQYAAPSGRCFVTVGSLDEADDLERGYHLWTSSRLPWVNFDNDLPKYEEDKVR
jgi:hypothetical protein